MSKRTNDKLSNKEDRPPKRQKSEDFGITEEIQLPEDVILLIFAHLGRLRDLCNIRLVSKQWKQYLLEIL